jgi:hypothetical protein
LLNFFYVDFVVLLVEIIGGGQLNVCVGVVFVLEYVYMFV